VDKKQQLYQAWVDFTFDIPLVALDQTAYIYHLRCYGQGGQQMLVQFANKKAYNMALAWGKDIPMVLSGYWHTVATPRTKAPSATMLCTCLFCSLYTNR
jgi:hypothetical protein